MSTSTEVAWAKKIPLIESMTFIERYDESQEILVRREFVVESFESYSAPVWGGALPISNGKNHLGRRRWVASLLSRSALRHYNVEVLQRAVDSGIAEALAAAKTENASIDLVDFLRTVLVRIAADLVGLEDMTTDKVRARRLLDLVDRWARGSSLLRYTRLPRERIIAEALEAMDDYNTEFFRPAHARRAALVERHLAGELTRDEIPDDLITRMALPDADQLWSEETAVRDSLAVLAAGLGTTSAGIVQTVDEYLKWPDRSAQDVDDPELVLGIVNESLRLFPPAPYILRRATADATLRSGREVPRGTEVAILVASAHRDPSVFGSDADEFRPNRYLELPPQYPQYGLAFGAGPHLCLGKPLVSVGGRDQRETTVPRVMSRLLEDLLRSGIRPAPSESPEKEDSYRDIFRTYPVVLDPQTRT